MTEPEKERENSMSNTIIVWNSSILNILLIPETEPEPGMTNIYTLKVLLPTIGARNIETVIASDDESAKHTAISIAEKFISDLNDQFNAVTTELIAARTLLSCN